MKKILFVLIFFVLFFPKISFGAIVYINGQLGNDTSGISETKSFDATGCDFMVIDQYEEAGIGDALAPSFNNVNFGGKIEQTQTINGVTISIAWWFLPAPSSGIHNITVNQTTSGSIRYAATCYSGINQSMIIDSSQMSGELDNNSAGNAIFNYNSITSANSLIIATTDNEGVINPQDDNSNGLTFKTGTNPGRTTAQWISNTTLSPGPNTIGVEFNGAYKTGIFAIALAPSTTKTMQALVVAGGGAGGTGDGGGGGAGGYQYDATHVVNIGSYSVTVGMGGSGVITSTRTGISGGNSIFDTITAIGGGGGGGYGGGSNGGLNGGSGGGGSSNIGGGNGKLPGSGTVGQGNNGGNPGTDSSNFSGGGGGGSGAVGGNGNSSGNGGDGGIGIVNSISGTPINYVGGGGGGSSLATGGIGSDGGGSGCSGSGSNGSNGIINTGSGGGGGCEAGGIGGNGGSGVVILSYVTSDWSGYTITGGIVTTDGVNTVRTFDSSGTLTITQSAQPTTLTATSTSGIYGGTVNLSATLATSTLGGVSGQSVGFTLHGAAVGTSTTDSNGVATLNNIYLTSDGTASGTPIFAGTYQTGIDAIFVGDNSTYSSSTSTTSLIVDPRSITVTADNKSKKSGASDPTLTFTHDTLVNGDTDTIFSGLLSRLVSENVGTTTITQGTLSAGNNYTITFVPGIFTIQIDPSQNSVIMATTTNADTSLSATIPSETVASSTSNGIIATFDIPSGTVVTGPSTWNGMLTLPIATTTYTLTASSGNTASAVEAIEIGAGDTSLTFNQPVKITFAGQVGKLIGWSQAGTFHPITNICDSTTTPTLSSGADCKINVGADLVVWTKHFSTFIAYTETPIAISAQSSAGGNGPIAQSFGVTTVHTNTAPIKLSANTDSNDTVSLKSSNVTKLVVIQNLASTTTSFKKPTISVQNQMIASAIHALPISTTSTWFTKSVPLLKSIFKFMFLHF